MLRAGYFDGKNDAIIKDGSNFECCLTKIEKAQLLIYMQSMVLQKKVIREEISKVPLSLIGKSLKLCAKVLDNYNKDIDY